MGYDLYLDSEHNESYEKTTEPRKGTILLIVEDDDRQRSVLEKLVADPNNNSDIADGGNLTICSAKSANEALGKLERYREIYPGSKLKAVLDYHMGLNVESGERKPTEALFYNPTFVDFLNNGSIVVIYSGYIDQARQSQEIIKVHDSTQNMALLFAEKGVVKADDIVSIMKVPCSSFSQLREKAMRYKHNLAGLLVDIRKVAAQRDLARK